ncbi:hypothetical protein M422DRAFT_161700 [Sphaerobolus stellatus SS14]|nr:hypothetical protein M422DRAFT_161700 [Sphaerobolus stellatus SS14]
MSIPTETKAWVLQKEAVTEVDFSDSPNSTFTLKTLPIPSSIQDDSVLLKTIYLSNDPAQRGWIQENQEPQRLYLPPVKIGEVMRSAGVAKVIKVGGTSDDSDLKEGDLVRTLPGWAEYSVMQKSMCQRIDPLPGTSPSLYVGMFGTPGLTAYWGLTEVLRLQPGESIVVSGAAGAIGNVVVQLAKNVFAAKKVIAIVGSDEKAKYIKSVGADIAVNYKNPNFKQELIEATKGSVDTFYDNVGGEILDFMLTRMRRYGRVAACGAISTYNNPTCTKLENYLDVLCSRLQIQGFIVLDYFNRSQEGIKELQRAYEDKKLVAEGGETVIKASSIEDVPRIWHGLFEGKNQGKLVTEMP